MTSSEDHFESFAPHSQYKHLILKAYFDAWLRKLALRPGAGPSLCYVDACAGRGADEAGNDGSPVIAAKAALDASRQVAALRDAPLDISVIAIEKERDHYAALVDNLKPFAPAAEAMLGELREHLPSLLARFGETPTLYFIDPFGLAPLHADAVRQALRGAKNEVLLLFADQAALRHFGAAIATESKVTRRHREQLAEADSSLFPEMVKAEAATQAPKVARSQRAFEITKERAVEILNAAFGGTSWRAEIEKVPEGQRRARFRALYAEFLRTCDAAYVLDIPVFNEDREHVYTLIHATKSEHGYRTMKEAVASGLKKAPLPAAAIDAIRAQMYVPLEPVVERLHELFAGQTTRWAEDKADKSSFSLKHFVLCSTEIPCFQLDELKGLLKPLRLRGRSEVYAFPPRLIEAVSEPRRPT